MAFPKAVVCDQLSIIFFSGKSVIFLLSVQTWSNLYMKVTVSGTLT